MNISSLIRPFSNLADQAVLLPLSATIGATLFFQWKKGAIVWILGMIITFGIIVLSKLMCYMIVGHWPFNVGLRSPSGHVAAGAAIYGSLFALIVSRGESSVLAAFIFSSVLAWFFAVTRLDLGVHTRSEVIVGSVIGIVSAILIAKFAGTKPSSFSPVPLTMLSLLIVSLTYGSMLRSEPVIFALSHRIKAALVQRF
jgi:membrane-associated phospholipid phosphatase